MKKNTFKNLDFIEIFILFLVLEKPGSFAGSESGSFFKITGSHGIHLKIYGT
jgi:hypothetical protein